ALFRRARSIGAPPFQAGTLLCTGRYGNLVRWLQGISIPSDIVFLGGAEYDRRPRVLRAPKAALPETSMRATARSGQSWWKRETSGMVCNAGGLRPLSVRARCRLFRAVQKPLRRIVQSVPEQSLQFSPRKVRAATPSPFR